MKLKNFGSLYNLLDSNIIDINNDNNLIIKASFEFYQEFMANGCRSDFEYEEIYSFEFVGCNIKIKKDSIYKVNKFKVEEDILYININSIDYIIKCDDVLIKEENN